MSYRNLSNDVQFVNGTSPPEQTVQTIPEVEAKGSELTISDPEAPELSSEILKDSIEAEADFNQSPVRRGLLTGWRGIALGLGLGILGTVIATQFSGQQSARTGASQEANPASIATAEPTASQTVTVAAVESAPVTRKLQVTGTVEAYDLLPILPQTTGLQIKQVLVKEGDSVQTGQVMAILDDSVLQSQIAQARAQIESAQAQVLQAEAQVKQSEANQREVETGTQQSNATVRQSQAQLERSRAEVIQAEAAVSQAEAEIKQAEAGIKQAQAALEQARREQARTQTLVEEGVVSRQDLEIRDTEVTQEQEDLNRAQQDLNRAEQELNRAKEAVRVAQSQVNIAQAEVQAAQADVQSTQAQVESAATSVLSAAADVRDRQAGVRSQQAQLQQLQTQLEQTVVRAPANGVVAERFARVGDVTNGTEQLYTLIADNQLELLAEVPETQLSQVGVGAPVQITSDADPNLDIRGTVREIAPLIDPNSRKATVKVDLPPINALPNSVLRPGMFLRAAITTASTQGLAVPAQAVLPQADGTSIVYRLQPDETVIATPVVVGEITGQFEGDLSQATAEIRQGLEQGDRVVVSGAGYLKDGDKVNVVVSP
ncbi:MAG: efflux RND transporter periplasmic adaptor subunit [Microcoleaceae cyanobacterium]